MDGGEVNIDFFSKGCLLLLPVMKYLSFSNYSIHSADLMNQHGYRNSEGASGANSSLKDISMELDYHAILMNNKFGIKVTLYKELSILNI